MIIYIEKHRFSPVFRLISGLIILTFCSSLVILPPQIASAQVMPMPVPGTMVGVSPAYIPSVMKGIRIHPENPLRFDFIMDTGHSNFEDEQRREEYDRLIKYFLAALTVPEKDLWVNLSPYEKDRIIPEAFGVTEMGRDLLAQDYLLKQITASLMYPEDELGQKFWDRIREKARSLYGAEEIPTNTFNKVWIVPENAVVYERDNMAFVVESRLRVMLESDYEAMKNASVRNGLKPFRTDMKDNPQVTQIIREIIIPEIEKEVNEGENFVALRQIYNSLILATWYKRKLHNSFLSQVYVGQNKVDGVDIVDKQEKQKIYEQYLKAFEIGVYNYIKEDYDPATQEVIQRKYFSGGFGFTDMALTVSDDQSMAARVKEVGIWDEVGTVLNPSPDRAEVATMPNANGQQLMLWGKATAESLIKEKLASVDYENRIIAQSIYSKKLLPLAYRTMYLDYALSQAFREDVRILFAAFKPFLDLEYNNEAKMFLNVKQPLGQLIESLILIQLRWADKEEALNLLSQIKDVNDKRDELVAAIRNNINVTDSEIDDVLVQGDAAMAAREGSVIEVKNQLPAVDIGNPPRQADNDNRRDLTLRWIRYLDSLESNTRARLKKEGVNFNDGQVYLMPFAVIEVLNKIAISQGFLLGLNPAGFADEKAVILYSIENESVEYVEQEKINVYEVREVTSFSNGMVHGAFGWSSSIERYVAVNVSQIEQYDNNRIKRVLEGYKVVIADQDAAKEEELRRLRDISDALITKGMSAYKNDRNTRLALMKESVLKHELDHHLRRRRAESEDGRFPDKSELDERLANLEAMRSASEPLWTLAKIVGSAYGERRRDVISDAWVLLSELSGQSNVANIIDWLANITNENSIEFVTNNLRGAARAAYSQGEEQWEEYFVMPAQRTPPSVEYMLQIIEQQFEELIVKEPDFESKVSSIRRRTIEGTIFSEMKVWLNIDQDIQEAIAEVIYNQLRDRKITSVEQFRDAVVAAISKTSLINKGRNIQAALDMVEQGWIEIQNKPKEVALVATVGITTLGFVVTAGSEMRDNLMSNQASMEVLQEPKLSTGAEASKVVDKKISESVDDITEGIEPVEIKPTEVFDTQREAILADNPSLQILMKRRAELEKAYDDYGFHLFEAKEYFYPFVMPDQNIREDIISFILATEFNESNYRTKRQAGDGPAFSYAQIERETFKTVLVRIFRGKDVSTGEFVLTVALGKEKTEQMRALYKSVVQERSRSSKVLKEKNDTTIDKLLTDDPQIADLMIYSNVAQELRMSKLTLPSRLEITVMGETYNTAWRPGAHISERVRLKMWSVAPMFKSLQDVEADLRNTSEELKFRQSFYASLDRTYYAIQKGRRDGQKKEDYLKLARERLEDAKQQYDRNSRRDVQDLLKAAEDMIEGQEQTDTSTSFLEQDPDASVFKIVPTGDLSQPFQLTFREDAAMAAKADVSILMEEPVVVSTSLKENAIRAGASWNNRYVQMMEDDIKRNGLDNFDLLSEEEVERIIPTAGSEIAIFVHRRTQLKIIGKPIFKEENNREAIVKFISLRREGSVPTFMVEGYPDAYFELNLLDFGYRTLDNIIGPELEKLTSQIAEQLTKKMYEVFRSGTEEWFVHGHLHTWNILVKVDNLGRVEDIKFIDWKKLIVHKLSDYPDLVALPSEEDSDFVKIETFSDESMISDVSDFAAYVELLKSGQVSLDTLEESELVAQRFGYGSDFITMYQAFIAAVESQQFLSKPRVVAVAESILRIAQEKPGDGRDEKFRQSLLEGIEDDLRNMLEMLIQERPIVFIEVYSLRSKITGLLNATEDVSVSDYQFIVQVYNFIAAVWFGKGADKIGDIILDKNITSDTLKVKTTKDLIRLTRETIAQKRQLRVNAAIVRIKEVLKAGSNGKQIAKQELTIITNVLEAIQVREDYPRYAEAFLVFLEALLFSNSINTSAETFEMHDGALFEGFDVAVSKLLAIANVASKPVVEEDSNSSLPLSRDKKSYYEVLGVERDASFDELKKKFYALSFKNFPKSDNGARGRFNDIALAYELLSDPKKREVYDDFMRFLDSEKDTRAKKQRKEKNIGGDKMMSGKDRVGGIDLNPENLDIKTRGEGVDFKLPEELKYLENIPINGFTPIIFQIIPVTNVPLLLGLVDEEGNPTSDYSQDLNLSPLDRKARFKGYEPEKLGLLK